MMSYFLSTITHSIVTSDNLRFAPIPVSWLAILNTSLTFFAKISHLVKWADAHIE